MAEQFLHCSDIIVCLQKMCGKRVAEGVGRNGLTLKINSDDLRELVSSSMGFPQRLDNS